MKNKSLVQVLVWVLVIVCLYQLSFTVVSRRTESKLHTQAETIAKRDNKSESAVYKQLIDSIRHLEIYPVLGYSYQKCKERSIDLGLDLQGGMNITLEISSAKMIMALANDKDDAKLNEALTKAQKSFLGQGSFIDYFADEYEKLSANTGLGLLFYNDAHSDDLPKRMNSTNKDVYAWLKKQEKSKIDENFKVLSTRIDQFNVTQPNIQKLDNGRILVELPGVDDPKRATDLITKSAKLEFWEVYRNDEVLKTFYEADSLLGLKLNGDITAEAAKADSNSTSLKSVDVNNALKPATANPDSSSLALLDSNKNKDSAADKNQLTQEQLTLKYPLMAGGKFIPPFDQSGKLYTNTAVGYANEKNKAFIDEKFLGDKDIMSTFPSDMVFRWSHKGDENGNYTLYALRASGDGPVLDGDGVESARKDIGQNGQFEVTMKMNIDASNEWEQITQAASNKTDGSPKDAIAIVLDDRVYSAPVVQNTIPNGISNITGNFTSEEAEDLANVLNAGRLQVPMAVAENTVVGPTLGKKSIKSGLTSLVIGFLSVIAFMVAYYSRAGVYAVIALLANLFFILGVLAGMGTALTLPGMAGLVLTIGMAVDANVLIFERVKEELKEGKTFKAAIKNGYNAALSSIIDANVTTLIAAILLYSLGKGPVAGFGIILLIGILSSLFTSILLTRLFVERDIAKGRETSFFTSFSKDKLSGFNYNFIENRKKFYVISGAVIILGIASFFVNGFSSGVDFKGGWSYVVDIEGASNTQEIKNAIAANLKDKSSVEVKTYGEVNRYRITTAYRINDRDSGIENEVRNTVIGALGNKYKVDIQSESKIGPTIAEDTKRASTSAIILSLIGMFIYIAIRFRKWVYGLGATVALFHDVLIVFAIYSIFYKISPFAMDIDQAFIAAILTVVGYSINDTVVVFDRVREFLGSHKYETNTAGVINDAINQTLSRTLVTSFTTWIVVLILFLIGGEGLKGFTFALLVGIGVGTYSSICIATPIVVDFLKRNK
ncbi:MAG: protein translocase subunit SecDF [Flavobacteriales bacterium]|nr:protein translocase subunit SecDF [Flavobacteriales bacterium]